MIAENCHILFFWDSECEGPVYMLCGQSVTVDDEALIHPETEDFIGETGGRVSAKQLARVTCGECRSRYVLFRETERRFLQPRPVAA